MKKILPLTAVAALTVAAIPNTQAATTIIDDTLSRRANDTNYSGTGDGTGNASQTGSYGSGVNISAVFSFQMSGIDPLDITGANFSVTQAVTGDTTGFDAVAYAIRTSSSSGVLNSDYEDEGTFLMSNFDNDSTVGSVSLDATAQTTLGAYLASNWADGEYVFIGIKSDTPVIDNSGDNALYNYSSGNNASDAKLTITTVPEPSSTALLGLGGLALILRRRK